MAKPEIRLKGFKGEWSNLSITKIATLKAGKNFNKNDAVDFPMNGYYPCYGGNGQRGYVPYYNQEGTFNIIGRQGALCGCVNIADGKFYATEHAVLVTPIVDTDFNFLHESLVRANINQYATGAAQPGISVANVNAQLFLNMPLLDEQKAVGDYFKSLDSMIQGVTKKIASLKQMKQACLVSMFPQVGETTPRVRFKGFKGEWENVSFKDITYLSGTKNRDNLPLESYSISNEKGFVPQNEQFEQGGTMANADKRLYYIVTPDSFAYNPARINVGSIGYDDLDKDVIVSSLYVVFKTDDNTNNYFLNHWFKTPMFRNMIELYQEGGVRLYFFYDKLCQCHFRRPCLAEQEKIASFFTSLDKQISLQEARLEKLKQIKAACLDKMFV